MQEWAPGICILKHALEKADMGLELAHERGGWELTRELGTVP